MISSGQEKVQPFEWTRAISEGAGLDPQLVKESHSGRHQSLAADFAARKQFPVNEQDLETESRQADGRGRSGDACPHNQCVVNRQVNTPHLDGSSGALEFANQ
jgi:hypothetical protein